MHERAKDSTDFGPPDRFGAKEDKRMRQRFNDGRVGICSKRSYGQRNKNRPRSLVVLLKHLLKINLEISREINQMARERRMQGRFALSEYQELIQFLEKLNQNYENLVSQVMEAAMEQE